MCIICLEFSRTKDLFDARQMLASARREPGAIPEQHLDDVEEELTAVERSRAASAAVDSDKT